MSTLKIWKQFGPFAPEAAHMHMSHSIQAAAFKRCITRDDFVTSRALVVTDHAATHSLLECRVDCRGSSDWLGNNGRLHVFSWLHGEQWWGACLQNGILLEAKLLAFLIIVGQELWRSSCLPTDSPHEIQCRLSAIWGLSYMESRFGDKSPPEDPLQQSRVCVRLMALVLLRTIEVGGNNVSGSGELRTALMVCTGDGTGR